MRATEVPAHVIEHVRGLKDDADALEYRRIPHGKLPPGMDLWCVHEPLVWVKWFVFDAETGEFLGSGKQPLAAIREALWTREHFTDPSERDRVNAEFAVIVAHYDDEPTA